MIILAVDLGEKRSGFAVSDPRGKLALALPTLADAAPADVARVAEEQRVEKIVLGLPLNMDGTEGPAARRVQAFAEALRHHIDLPVETWDERLSTAEGEARLRDAGFDRRERSRRSDVAAALVILESYLAAHSSEGSQDGGA